MLYDLVIYQPIVACQHGTVVSRHKAASAVPAACMPVDSEYSSRKYVAFACATRVIKTSITIMTLPLPCLQLVGILCTYLWNQVLWQVVKSVTTVAKLMGLLAPALCNTMQRTSSQNSTWVRSDAFLTEHTKYVYIMEHS